MIITIFQIIIAYLVVALLTEIWIMKKYPDEYNDVCKRHSHAELWLAFGWPIFWIGLIIGYIQDLFK